jgi:hypothetical protein
MTAAASTGVAGTAPVNTHIFMGETIASPVATAASGDTVDFPFTIKAVTAVVADFYVAVTVIRAKVRVGRVGGRVGTGTANGLVC